MTERELLAETLVECADCMPFALRKRIKSALAQRTEQEELPPCPGCGDPKCGAPERTEQGPGNSDRMYHLAVTREDSLRTALQRIVDACDSPDFDGRPSDADLIEARRVLDGHTAQRTEPVRGFTCPNCKHHTWWTDELTATSPPEHTEQEPVCNIEVTDGRLSSIDWLYTFRGNATARLALDDGKHALYARPVPTEQAPVAWLWEYQIDGQNLRLAALLPWTSMPGATFIRQTPLVPLYDSPVQTEQEPVAWARLWEFERRIPEERDNTRKLVPYSRRKLIDSDMPLYARPVLDDEGMRLLREAKDRIVGWCTRFDLMPDASAEILAAIDAYLAKLKPISSHRD